MQIKALPLEWCGVVDGGAAVELGIDPKALIWEAAQFYVSGLSETATFTLVTLLKEASLAQKMKA